MTSASVSVAAIEAARTDTLAFISRRFGELIDAAAGQPASVKHKLPTPEDGRDPRNKIGLNLTARGVEILNRMFDDGAGYNRASKMLNITQAAAKNRKKGWEKARGRDRERMVLDIDE